VESTAAARAGPGSATVAGVAGAVTWPSAPALSAACGTPGAPAADGGSETEFDSPSASSVVDDAAPALAEPFSVRPCRGGTASRSTSARVPAYRAATIVA